MADEADIASEREELIRARAIAAAIRPVPVGVPGICDDCGEDSPRLCAYWVAIGVVGGILYRMALAVTWGAGQFRSRPGREDR